MQDIYLNKVYKLNKSKLQKQGENMKSRGGLNQSSTQNQVIYIFLHEYKTKQNIKQLPKNTLSKTLNIVVCKKNENNKNQTELRTTDKENII